MTFGSNITWSEDNCKGHGIGIAFFRKLAGAHAFKRPSTPHLDSVNGAGSDEQAI